MKRQSFYFGIAAIVCAAFAGTSFAQSPAGETATPSQASSSTSYGVIEHANPPPIVHGDTTTVNRGNAAIVFEPAGMSDIETAQYKVWNDYASAHPEVERALAYNPRLADNPHFLKKHPSLAQLYQAHPDLHDAIVADPGNFAAIPPRPGE
jgi:hypothetical protein